MKGESKIISGAKTKMHVFMSDLLGSKLGAANIKKQMLPGDKENGREETTHQASEKERKEINKSTRGKDGDYAKEEESTL